MNAMIGALTLSLFASTHAEAGFRREVLVVAEYGGLPGEVGLYLTATYGPQTGVTDISATDRGAVYLADEARGAIRKFDSEGEIEWVVEHVDCVNGIAVDDDGNVYAAGGGAVDLTGDVTKVDNRGVILWNTRRGYADRRVMLSPEELNTARGEIIQLEERFFHSARLLVGLRVEEGKEVRDRHGRVYRVIGGVEREVRPGVVKVRTDSLIVIAIEDGSGSSNEVRIPGAARIAVDERGRIWAIQTEIEKAEPRQIVESRKKAERALKYDYEMLVRVFHGDGAEMAELRLDQPPGLLWGAELEVKRDGSVVLLEYFPEHVEVVRYVLEEGEGAKGLGEDDTAAAAVETQLTSRDPTIRRKGVGVLVSKGEAGLEEVVGMLRTSDKMVQGGAAEALGRIGDKRAVEPLLEVVQSPERFVRRRVVEALGEIGEARAVGALTARLSDEDWFTRYKAAQALGKTGDSRAIAALLEALEDDNRYVREEAGAALRSMCGVEQLDALADAMGHQDFLVRTEATSVLKSITERTRDMRTLGLLVRAISDAAFGNPEIAATAVGYLGEAAADTLLPLLGARYAHVRVQAAAALGEIRCMRAVEPLLRLLDMKEPTIRLASIRALGQIGDARAIDRLAELVVARDEHSWDAARSLGMIGPPALNVLLEFVGSDDFFVRHDAVSGLAKIDDARAREALRKASNDPHPLVQETARRILLGLDGVE